MSSRYWWTWAIEKDAAAELPTACAWYERRWGRRPAVVGMRPEYAEQVDGRAAGVKVDALEGLAPMRGFFYFAPPDATERPAEEEPADDEPVQLALFGGGE